MNSAKIQQGMNRITSVFIRRLGFFTKKGSPTEALRRAYILAFAVIAILTILTHTLTSFITTKQHESTEVAYKISRQTGLMQQVLIDGYTYFNSSSDIDRDFLQQTVRQLANTHYSIMASVKNGYGYFSGKSLYRSYFEQPFMLSEKINDFVKAAEAIATYPPGTMEDTKKSVLRNINTKISKLQPLLDSAVAQYQVETDEMVSRNYMFQKLSVILIMMVLGFEAVFIFRPLILRINSYHRMLIKQAMEDPLTGLHNRRAFTRLATCALMNAAKSKTSLCVVLCDLDHFKSVNDVYGHDVGDKVLQHFSNLLKTTLRQGDVIGRIGGEEFAIILNNNTDAASGVKVLRRFGQKVAATACPYQDDNGKDQLLNYTTSIGCYALVPQENSQDMNILDMLKIADEALYEAKEQGRNRVVLASVEGSAASGGGADGAAQATADSARASGEHSSKNADEQKKGPETLISGQTAIIEGV